MLDVMMYIATSLLITVRLVNSSTTMLYRRSPTSTSPSLRRATVLSTLIRADALKVDTLSLVATLTTGARVLHQRISTPPPVFLSSDCLIQTCSHKLRRVSASSSSNLVTLPWTEFSSSESFSAIPSPIPTACGGSKVVWKNGVGSGRWVMPPKEWIKKQERYGERDGDGFRNRFKYGVNRRMHCSMPCIVLFTICLL